MNRICKQILDERKSLPDSELSPLLRALLLASTACVNVGPPLFCSGPSCGSIAVASVPPPMKFPLASGVAPTVAVNPLPVLLPIRLRKTVSASVGDLRMSGAVPLSVFSATMLLLIVIGDEML